LQDAEQNDLHGGLRQTAEHRGKREAHHRDEEQALLSEAAGEKTGRRRHYGGSDDIGGQHPRDLLLAGRHTALDMGQRHIGDCGVERLHEGSKDHTGGDRRPVDTCGFSRHH
jgi:hypothetical protein